MEPGDNPLSTNRLQGPDWPPVTEHAFPALASTEASAVSSVGSRPPAAATDRKTRTRRTSALLERNRRSQPAPKVQINAMVLVLPSERGLWTCPPAMPTDPIPRRWHPARKAGPQKSLGPFYERLHEKSTAQQPRLKNLAPATGLTSGPRGQKKRPPVVWTSGLRITINGRYLLSRLCPIPSV